MRKFNFKLNHKLMNRKFFFKAKIEDKVIDEQVNKLGTVDEKPKKLLKKLRLTNLRKLNLRVAKILQPKEFLKLKSFKTAG
jgi:hypothetical protein